ncbi:CAP domain-containing protein [Pontibacillus sp. HMF3514]|uniref:CAP domain-containing protein n=1 Tax=Pontibacillus sp. HMF3514 TaxID=2692425 RepID=UPI00131FDAB6|nr:CAP domain-containing protein [Pontibacillus sp. HMF3514]QHE51028.1 sporulation protein [Pontibacillus sp. HMF3514]
MFKKIAITTALATGVLMGSPFQSEASAQSNKDIQLFTNIQSNQQIDQEQINQWMNQILSNYEIQRDKQEGAKQPAQEETQKQQQPTQKQPEQNEQDQAQATPTTPSQQNEATQQQPTEQEQKQGYELSQYEQKVIELTNEKRAEQGLSPLKIDKELSKVARKKSQDMAQNNYFSHNSPTYGSPFDMMKQFGIEYRTAGENIAKGQRSPQEVVNAWMNSAGHRKNILNENFTHIGVGFEENGNVWTQQFIGK